MPSDKSLQVVNRSAGSWLTAQASQWLAEQRLLTAAEVGEVLQISNAAYCLRRWRDQSRVLSIPVSHGHLYPAFQFDGERLRLRPEVSRRLAAMAPTRGPWEQIEMWASASLR